MLGGLGALCLGVLVILVGLFGGLGGKRKQSLESRIDVYTRRGAGQRTAPTQAPQGVAAQAVDLATKALETNKGFEVKLSKKLEAAALPFRPAEWLLLHAAIAFGASAVVFMLSGGSLVMAAAGWFGGALLAWMYLGFKASRRLKAFNGQLAGDPAADGGKPPGRPVLRPGHGHDRPRGRRAGGRRVPPRPGRDTAGCHDRGRPRRHRRPHDQ